MDKDQIAKQVKGSVTGSTALHNKYVRVQEGIGEWERAKFFRKQAERLFKLASECTEQHLRDQLLALANEYVGLADAAAQAITEP